MGLLDIFSGGSQTGGLLQSQQAAYGIDPNEVRKQAMQQALLQAASGMLQGRNLGTGLAGSLGGFAQGYSGGRKNAMEEGILNYKMKQDAETQKRQQDATQGILASMQGMFGNNVPAPQGPQPNTGVENANLPAVPPAGGFDKAVNFVLNQEGGYVENDAGHGPTNFGINSQANPDVDVKALDQNGAIDIYKNKYWKAIDGDNLPPDVATVAFDTAVNNGISVAKQLLQETAGQPDQAQKIIEKRRALYGELASSEDYKQYADTWDKRMKALSNEIAPQQTAMPGSEAAPQQQGPLAGLDDTEKQMLVQGVQMALGAGKPEDAQKLLMDAAKTSHERTAKTKEPLAANVINLQSPDGTIKGYDANRQQDAIAKALEAGAVEIGTGQALAVDINGDGVPEITMGGKTGGGKLTEVQSKDIGFHDMAALGNSMINEITGKGFDPSGWGSFAKWQTGAAGEATMTTDEQQYFAGVRAFINSILRKDSGAAITEEEWKGNYPLYFPMPGNGAEVQAFKSQLRQSRIDSLKKGLGSASSLVSDKPPEINKPPEIKAGPGTLKQNKDGSFDWVPN